MNNFRLFLRQAHPVTQLLVLMVVVIFCTGILSTLGLLFTQVLYGMGAEEVTNAFLDYNSQANVKALKVLQLFYSLGLFLLPAMIFAQLQSRQPTIFLRINKWPNTLALLAILVLMVVFTPITDALSWVNNQLQLPQFLAQVENEMHNMAEKNQELTQHFLQMDGWGDFLFTLLLMAVVPALGEEFLFRGILQRLLKNYTHKMHLAVWVTALVFALMHQQFFALLPLVVLGAILGYLKEWTGSLWASVFAHFVNNATIVFVMFFGNYNMSAANADETPEWLYFGGAAVLVAGILFYLIKNKVGLQNPTDDVSELPT